ncbi:MAG: PAS domain S-box protein [Opitutaceae bacterium]|nr:PAS domain S-box protein [Opitutaceae bacterium]
MTGWISENRDYLLFVFVGFALFGLLEAWLRLRTPRGSLPWIVWPTLVILWVLGWILVYDSGRAESRRIQESLKGIAPTYAQEITLLDHANITLTTAPDDPTYLRIIEKMKRWLALNQDISDVYTYRLSDEGIRLMVDSETDYDRSGAYDQPREQRTQIGKACGPADPGMYRALRGEMSFTENVVTDEWGVWVSAFVPLLDAQGRIEGGLGVDYPAEKFLQAVAMGRERMIWLLSVPLLILGFTMATTGALRAEIGARRKVEEQLRESEAQMRTALDSIPFDFWVMDADGRYILNNAASRAHWGDSIGKTLADLDVPADTRAKWERNNHRAFAGEIVRGEVFLEVGGQRHFFYNVIAPVRVGEKIAGILGLNVDLTDRVSAEEALRASERRLSLHVRQTPLAVIEWDPEFRVTAWNPSAERIFGFTEAEVLGNNIATWIVPESANAHVEQVWRAVMARYGGSRSINQNLTKDGRTILCDWYNTPLIDEGGRVIGVASHCEDITQRDALEKHLRQTQKIESLGQLAAGVAHEFNNLLTPMLLRLEMLRSDRAGDPDLLMALRSIEDAIDQAAQLNQRILAVGRRSAEKREMLALNPVIDDTVGLLRHTLDRRITLEVRLSPGLGPLMLDRAQVSQIVVNLVLNARDAVLEKCRPDVDPMWSPRITVTTTAVDALPPAELGVLEKPASRACQRLSVEDNGTGMTDEVRAHIFEPFYTTKAPGQGTGLGLAVVWNIVKNLDGWIDVISKPGKGTTFDVYLPVSVSSAEGAARAKPAGAKPSEGWGNGGLRILLADDNVFVADTLNHLLAREGHEVTYATNGDEAWSLWTSGGGAATYDLVVTDQNMPVVTGVEFVRRLRASGSSVPVVVVSGHLAPGLTVELNSLGVTSQLAKPFTQKELLSAVGAALRG